MRTAENTGERR